MIFTSFVKRELEDDLPRRAVDTWTDTMVVWEGNPLRRRQNLLCGGATMIHTHIIFNI